MPDLITKWAHSFFLPIKTEWVRKQRKNWCIYIYVLLDLSKFRDPSQLINIPQIFIHLTQAISLRNLNDPFGELFSKIIFKSSREFLFWQKIRTFEIGQNVPNLHNFYRAFSAFSQRSYKTTKNYLGFIFFISCFSSLGIAFPLYFISN